MKYPFSLFLCFAAMVLLSSAFLQQSMLNTKVRYRDTKRFSKGVILSRGNIIAGLSRVPCISSGTPRCGSNTAVSSLIAPTLFTPARLSKGLSIVGASAAATYLYKTNNKDVRLWLFALRFSLQMLRAEVILKRWGNEESYKIAQDACAKLLTERLMQMGPTFVKLGQLLSTRGDILPIVFIAHLSKLQDDVPPFPGHIAIKTIEKELGKPIDHIYDYFDPIPFAAASLGQVHKAMLGGRKLAVKVQRLGLYDQIKEDLKHIKVFVRLSVWLDRGNDGVQRDWNGIYTQLSELLLSELDYYQEAENARRFLRMFVDDNTEWVKVPEVYTNMSSASVLTMELVEGVRMDNPGAIRAAGIDPKTISRRLIESYLMQFCRHGFYHCDPHPGNIACDNSVRGGRIIYYDFGMMKKLSNTHRDAFADVACGLIESNVSLVQSALKTLGALTGPEQSLSGVNDGRQRILDSSISTSTNNSGGAISAVDKSVDTKDNKSTHSTREQQQQHLQQPQQQQEEYDAVVQKVIHYFMRQLSIGTALGEAGRNWVKDVLKLSTPEQLRMERKQKRDKLRSELMSVSKDKQLPFQFPSEFTAAQRAFAILEGVCSKLDPDYELRAVALPFIQEMILRRRRQLDIAEYNNNYGNDNSMTDISFVRGVGNARTVALKLAFKAVGNQIGNLLKDAVSTVNSFASKVFQTTPLANSALNSVGYDSSDSNSHREADSIVFNSDEELRQYFSRGGGKGGIL